MSREGRIEGRVNGNFYELVQYGEVRQSLPIAEVRENQRFLETIRKNKWQAI